MKTRPIVAVVTLLAALMLSAVGAQAQLSQPPPLADHQFATEAAMAGLAEVQLGQLAIQRAGSESVRQFAQRLVQDHSQANSELVQIATQANIVLPQSVDPAHQALRDRLAGLSGAEFDRVFMQEMIGDHAKAVAMFERAAQTVSNPALRAWAARRLPVLRQHHAVAQAVHTQLAGLPAPGAALPAGVVVSPPWCGGAYAPPAGSNFGICPR